MTLKCSMLRDRDEMPSISTDFAICCRSGCFLKFIEERNGDYWGQLRFVGMEREHPSCFLFGRAWEREVYCGTLTSGASAECRPCIVPFHLPRLKE